MTRIIAGSARGRRLKVPGSGTRPTSDRIREALFASIDSRLLSEGKTWGDVAVCDLWAGSGAIGLEAWSRGAVRVLAVEKSKAAAAVIAGNIAELGAGGVVDMRRSDVSSLVTSPPPGGPFDIVFADPPYDYGDESLGTDLANARRSGWFAPDALIAVERGTPRGTMQGVEDGGPLPPGVDVIDRRPYGDSVLWYGRVSGE